MSEPNPPKWSVPRVEPRYLMDQRLVIRGERTLHGRTKDISESGIGATVAGELNIGEVVELEFYLTGSLTPVKLNAQVKYRQGFQYGFHFIGITELEKSGIREAARNLQPVG
jgi:PilZ domain